MSRHRRGSSRRDEPFEERRGQEREFSRDEPWREERRARYPDEPYGGEPARPRGDSRVDFRPDQSQFNTPDGPGRGYGYGFGDSADYRPQQPRRGDSGAWNRGRTSGGYGSEFGSWSAGYDVGPDEPRNRDSGGFEDADWVANRPARGPGQWSGDWSQAPGEGRPRANYSGRGPRDYRRSDDRLREEICERFTDDAELDPSDVSVHVEACEVTLTGVVSSRDQKRRAEYLAERVRGVRDVSNQLRINAGGDMSANAQASGQTSARGTGGARSSSGVAADKER
jgi:hypothetical protein